MSDADDLADLAAQIPAGASGSSSASSEDDVGKPTPAVAPTPKAARPPAVAREDTLTALLSGMPDAADEGSASSDDSDEGLTAAAFNTLGGSSLSDDETDKSSAPKAAEAIADTAANVSGKVAAEKAAAEAAEKAAAEKAALDEAARRAAVEAAIIAAKVEKERKRELAEKRAQEEREARAAEAASRDAAAKAAKLEMEKRRLAEEEAKKIAATKAAEEAARRKEQDEEDARRRAEAERQAAEESRKRAEEERRKAEDEKKAGENKRRADEARQEEDRRPDVMSREADRKEARRDPTTEAQRDPTTRAVGHDRSGGAALHNDESESGGVARRAGRVRDDDAWARDERENGRAEKWRIGGDMSAFEAESARARAAEQRARKAQEALGEERQARRHAELALRHVREQERARAALLRQEREHERRETRRAGRRAREEEARTTREERAKQQREERQRERDDRDARDRRLREEEEEARRKRQRADDERAEEDRRKRKEVRASFVMCGRMQRESAAERALEEEEERNRRRRRDDYTERLLHDVLPPHQASPRRSPQRATRAAAMEVPNVLLDAETRRSDGGVGFLIEEAEHLAREAERLARAVDRVSSPLPNYGYSYPYAPMYAPPPPVAVTHMCRPTTPPSEPGYELGRARAARAAAMEAELELAESLTRLTPRLERLFSDQPVPPRARRSFSAGRRPWTYALPSARRRSRSPPQEVGDGWECDARWADDANERDLPSEARPFQPDRGLRSSPPPYRPYRLRARSGSRQLSSSRSPSPRSSHPSARTWIPYDSVTEHVSLEQADECHFRPRSVLGSAIYRRTPPPEAVGNLGASPIATQAAITGLPWAVPSPGEGRQSFDTVRSSALVPSLDGAPRVAGVSARIERLSLAPVRADLHPRDQHARAMSALTKVYGARVPSVSLLV